MVFLSRIDLRWSELFYVGLLDCTKRPHRKPSFWDGHWTGLESDYL